MAHNVKKMRLVPESYFEKLEPEVKIEKQKKMCGSTIFQTI